MIPYLYRGDGPEAIGLGEQAVVLCQRVEAPVLLPMIQSQLGHAYMLAGLGKLFLRTDRPDRAREHLETAHAMYRDMKMRFWLEKAERGLQR
jgi:hypothetical protein